MATVRHCRIICDACRFSVVEVPPKEVLDLPFPWRIVDVQGWGTFHACSTRCANAIRARYERPEPVFVIEPEGRSREDESTQPDSPSATYRATRSRYDETN